MTESRSGNRRASSHKTILRPVENVEDGSLSTLRQGFQSGCLGDTVDLVEDKGCYSKDSVYGDNFPSS